MGCKCSTSSASLPSHTYGRRWLKLVGQNRCVSRGIKQSPETTDALNTMWTAVHRLGRTAKHSDPKGRHMTDCVLILSKCVQVPDIHQLRHVGWQCGCACGTHINDNRWLGRSELRVQETCVEQSRGRHVHKMTRFRMCISV